MTEKEMEDLLWDYPEKFLNEPLTQFQRQAQTRVGRADLIFNDRLGRFLVVEIKRGTLERGAIQQLIDYFGMLKSKFPEKPVELMVVANSIPQERRLACEQYHIECREISEKRFRNVADEVGYTFQSERRDEREPEATLSAHAPSASRRDPPKATGRVEKDWRYWMSQDGKAYFLAFVNAKGSCSIRHFDAESGVFLGKKYESGDYQEVFREYLSSGTPVVVSHQPNLEKNCKDRLPGPVLAELRRQIFRSVP